MTTLARLSTVRVRLFAIVGLVLTIMASAGNAAANNRNLYLYHGYVTQVPVRCYSGTLQFSWESATWAKAYCHTYVSGNDWADPINGFGLYAGSIAHERPSNGRRVCPNTPWTGNGTSSGKFYVC